MASERFHDASICPPAPLDDRRNADRLVRALTLVTALQWLGASAILPLLPEYLRHRGGSDALVGAVMAAFFAAGVLCQYPAGRLADHIGRRPVLLMGLLCYAAASVAFLAPVSPVAYVGLRALQGAGAGAAEVASLAMVSGAVSLERRGRAFGSIYAGQLAGIAIGPLVGSLFGVGAMGIIFVAAGAASLVACLPVLVGSEFVGQRVSAAARDLGPGPRAPESQSGACRVAGGRRSHRAHLRRVRIVLDVATRRPRSEELADRVELEHVRRSLRSHGPSRWLDG